MFKTIPGFEKFEMDDTNKMIRSVKGKNVLEVKKGKVRLSDNNGDRKFYDVTDLFSKTFETKKVVKKETEKKEQKVKKSAPKVSKEPYGKLTDEDAKSIRKALKDKTSTAKELSLKFNVHVSSIYDVKNFIFKKEEISKKK